MSPLPARINLPLLPDNHIWSDNTLEFFYDSEGKLILPPSFFSHQIKRNIDRLTTMEINAEDGRSRPVLTEAGRSWTDDAWIAFPFLDSEQRDEFQRPFAKYDKTPENQLKFALHVKTYFSSSAHVSLVFGNHIFSALQQEVVRRCTEDGMTLPNADPPRTIDDVITIIKSDEMKKMFETDKNKVCTYIFHWIKSITLEENLSWVEEAIDQYFKDHSMQVRLATSQSNKTRRHSLIRIAVAKGTQSTKEKFKDVEERVFGWTLKMDVGVHPSSRDQKKIKTYLEMMASENYILVRLDPSIVPKSRKKTPLYWLKRANAAEEENVPNISTMLDVIVDAVASSEDLSFGELVQMLQDKVDRHDKGDSSAQELPYDPNTGTANVAVDGPNHGKNAPMEDQMENLFPSNWDSSLPESLAPMQETNTISNTTVPETSEVAADEAIPTEIVEDLNPPREINPSVEVAASTRGSTPIESETEAPGGDTDEVIPTGTEGDRNFCTDKQSSNNSLITVTPAASIDEDDHCAPFNQEYLHPKPFMIWVCPNATKSRWQTHDGMAPELLKASKQRECSYALCNDCRHSLLNLSATRSGRCSRKRKIDDPNECNHNDLTSGLRQEFNHTVI